MKKSLQINLQLTDKDLKRLYEITYSAGTTPQKLISGFVGDLIAGDDSGGSDERDLAACYMERRYCTELYPRGFLQWALYDYVLDDIAEALDNKAEAVADLAYYEDHPEEADSEETRFLQTLDCEADRQLDEFYNAYLVYKAQRGEPPQPYEEGIEAIRRYLNEVK